MKSNTPRRQITPHNNGMLYGIRDCPPLMQMTILAIQHVLAMFGATILVPILVNEMAGAEVLSIAVALVASGIGTLIYQFCTKSSSPVYLGSSFAFIAPIAAGFAVAGKAGAMTGIAIVGIIYVVFAALVAKIGNGWIDKVLPPVVIGPTIMVIGLGLAPSAISQIGLDGSDTNLSSAIVALVTVVTAIVVMVCVRGFLGVIPFLAAIVVGYIVAIPFGLVDFTPVKEATFFSLPHFQVMFYHYAPSFGAIWQIAPVALVTMAEHIGDHKALSTIVGEDLLSKKPGLHRTLLGDGLATLAAALIGGPANTTYGENTAVVGMTKVASVYVLRLAAVLAIVIGFMGKFTALISTIPGPVLGGVSILLYGFIALNGAKVWVKNQISFDVKRNIAISAPMLVLGLGGAVVSIVTGNLSISFSGMSLATLFGIILNLLLPEDKEEQLDIREREINERRLKVLLSDPRLLKEVDRLSLSGKE